MTDNQFGHHISQQFNAELEKLRHRVLAMGGLVEQQIVDAVKALVEGDSGLAEAVIENDHRVNAFEVSIDEQCAQILALRQPTASDLRLIVAVIKTIADLERIGDQSEKVARMGLKLIEQERPSNEYIEIQRLGERVQQMLSLVLDAFARMDAEAALEVVGKDEKIDLEYDGIMRQLVTFMMEDPRQIKRSLDIMWSVRALERIGDHAKNICEYIIYLVKGKDVRHTTLEQMKEAALGER
jgi:phosphate transport system protein